MNRILALLNSLLRPDKKIQEHSAKYCPTLRVTRIDKKNEEYFVSVQLINKNTGFKMRPEEILNDDKLTNQFSPTDVRTLTYLGYLGINKQNYKILAMRLSEKQDKMIFTIHRPNEKMNIVKTANEISADRELLLNLNQKDAHMIGFTTATEQIFDEEIQKQKISANVAEVLR